MKERPILFSAEMVRAILEGRKTQTRRVIKPQPVRVDNGIAYRHKTYQHATPCPYSVDRLWVREAFAEVSIPDGTTARKIITVYQADNPQGVETPRRWKPSIHMPRWASRITLEIINIRVERIQEITEEDAKAEGLKESPDVELRDGSPCYTLSFQNLWTQIHGIDNPKSWDANPFVWVIEFKRIK